MTKNKFLTLITITIIFLTGIFTVKSCQSKENKFPIKKSYENYKKNFMTKDGRIMDPEKNNITTSEGQSYMMLKSLIVGDRKTFDLVYKWSKNNLQRKDNLFSWLWGENKNKEYKTLDYNSASDADIDIAFALLAAYEKWGNYKYIEEAKPIIRAIWDKETKRFGNYLILMPGAEQTKFNKDEINPSYFNPYAFRSFQKYDELHDWNQLINSSYYYLKAVGEKTQTGLAPNWFLIDNNKIILEKSPKSDFSYDAIRVFARIYLDYTETGEKRALPILEKSKFFISEWKRTGNLYTNYQSNGMLKDTVQYTGSIAILIPVINMYDKKIAGEIYDKKIKPYLDNPENWSSKKDYYAKNLIWFGLHLYQKK